MKKDFSISIFFPAYNEEKNIRKSVEEAEASIKDVTDKYEIIVVNDGSSDSTGEIADEMALENEKVKVVHHNPNQGCGAAVWSGIQASKYDYIFWTDADLQFDMREIKNLIKHVPEYRAVIGYRAKRRDNFIRLINAKGWNILNRIFFGLKVRDIDCAFKLFERKLVANLPLKSRGAMMFAEMLIRLSRRGVVFKEIPVTHLPRKEGNSTGAKPSVIFRAFREMVYIYRNELGNGVHRQVFRFGAVGVLNTLIDIVAYIFLTRFILFFAFNIFLAKIISFILGTVSSFVFNRYWTFEMKEPFRISQLFKFYSTVGMGIVVNLGGMFFFVSILGFHDILAVIFATVLTFGWNFIFSKFWVFKTAWPQKKEYSKNL